MKKILFAFLFVILGFSLTTGGVVLLSGCSSSQTENGGGGDFAPPQNENEETEDVDEGEGINFDDESSDDMDNDATYYYLHFFGAETTTDQTPDTYYSSTGGGTQYFYANDKTPGTVTMTYSGTTISNQSFSGNYYRVTRTTSSTISITFKVTSITTGYTFAGWWAGDYNPDGADGGEENWSRVSTSTTYTRSYSGSISTRYENFVGALFIQNRENYFFHFYGAETTTDQSPDTYYSSTGGGTLYFYENDKSAGTVVANYVTSNYGVTTISNQSFSGAYRVMGYETSITVTFSVTNVPTGHVFAGWWSGNYNPDGADGGEEYWYRATTGTTYTETFYGNTTDRYPDYVGALFILNAYSIRVYAMTGISDITAPATSWYSNSTGRYKEVTVTYGTSYTIAVTVQSNYTFNRWTKTNSSSGTAVSTSATYSFTVGTSNTFYAWAEINTYTLTIRYYGGTTRQSNTTNLNITASSCTVSSSSIASGGSATVKHTYSTSSYSVVLKLSNSATYDYYLRTGSNPTTSTYTKLYTTSSDSYTYTWKPDSNDTLSIYVKQRYTITYNKNGGTGTLPSTTYKIHGTSVTLGTNNLTKTSYTYNGWNTNTTGTGTHYNSGGSYSTNASDTLYADWTPKTSTIKVQIKTSTNGSSYSNSATGGTVSVRYYYDSNNSPVQSSSVSVTSASATTIATNALISRAVTFTPTAKSGYVYVGISTSTSAPNSTATTFTPSSSGATYTINVFFKVLSTNQLKYDSTDKYWYFEHGEYPQSYVGTSMNNTLNSASPTKSGEIKYNDGTTNQKIEVYTYNSKRYARLQATSTQTLKMSDGTSYTFTNGQYYWFEVEPIRWRVSDYGVSSTTYPSGWSTYGTYKTNFTVVSDRILTIGAVETSDVNEGWAFKDSDIYSNISGLNKTASTTNFSASITNKQGSTNYTYYKFGSAGQQDKVVSVSVTEDGVRVASIEEIDDYLNDYSAKASDMVCFLLGCGTDDEVNYWTRNLGTSLSNGQIITSAGSPKSVWLDNVQGVRLALTMGNGSRI